MHWRNKRVLVTGGAGVIGKELLGRLEKLKSEISCLDVSPKPEKIGDAVGYHQVDISKINSELIRGFGPEVIFHLAATFERTEETPEFWEDNFRNNIILSHKVINAAKKCKNLEKFIFASSYLIYAPNLYLFNKPQTNPRKLKETDVVNPRNLVGAAKYYTEKELEFINTIYNGFISISARIYRVYGLGSRDIISRWVRMALNGDELIVFQKENMFDYVFAGDVAEGLVKIAETVNENEIINFGTGAARRIEEVIKILRDQIPDIKVKEIEKRELFEASCADISNLVKLTGWQTHTTLEEGIRKVVNYGKRVNYPQLSQGASYFNDRTCGNLDKLP